MIIFKIFPFKKAIPAVMAGIAFFLAACGPGTPVKKKGSITASTDHFVLAERYRKQGNMENALENYDRYVMQNPLGKRTAKSLHRMGEIYSGLKKHGEALNSFKRILKDHPQYTQTSFLK